MRVSQNWSVKIFADGADIRSMVSMASNPLVDGFTTNPTLMRAAGVRDYKEFAVSALRAVHGMPVSLEVFADDFPEMIRQGTEIASWGSNANVKIPITNTRGQYAESAVRTLSQVGVVVNVTAVFTEMQVEQVCGWLDPDTPSIISVFAGRIADTGINPMPLMKTARTIMGELQPCAELLWASTREVFNVTQAASCGCDIITCPPDIVNKLSLAGKSLPEYSLETVRQFYGDAVAAAYEV